MPRPTPPALWRCPACGQTFVSPDMAHSRVVLDVDAHFAGVRPGLREVFDALVAATREHHRLALERPEEIDAELKAWLADAHQVGAQRHLTDPPWPGERRPPAWVRVPREVAQALARGEDPSAGR